MKTIDHHVEIAKKNYSQNGIRSKYIPKVPKCRKHVRGSNIHCNLWLFLLLGIMKHYCFIILSIDMSKQWVHNYSIYMITYKYLLNNKLEQNFTLPWGVALTIRKVYNYNLSIIVWNVNFHHIAKKASPYFYYLKPFLYYCSTFTISTIDCQIIN